MFTLVKCEMSVANVIKSSTFSTGRKTRGQSHRTLERLWSCFKTKKGKNIRHKKRINSDFCEVLPHILPELNTRWRHFHRLCRVICIHSSDATISYDVFFILWDQYVDCYCSQCCLSPLQFLRHIQYFPFIYYNS